MFDKEKFEEGDFGLEAFAKINFQGNNKGLDCNEKAEIKGLDDL
jgi:hypothetical protein